MSKAANTIAGISKDQFESLMDQYLNDNEFEYTPDQEMVDKATDKALEPLRDEVLDRFKGLTEQLRKEMKLLQPIEIKINGTDKRWRIEDKTHRQFGEVLQWLTSKTKTGQWVPVWLWGSPGAGKTHLAEQLADALAKVVKAKNADTFYQPIYLGPTATEGKLLGYRNMATGEYVKGLAVDAYRNGGLLFLDEIDVADATVLVALNALLSNSSYRFPDGTLYKRHANFFVLAGANTLGKGSVEGFKRNAQDAASRDRFTKVRFYIDEGLEASLSLDSGWTQYVIKVRNFISTLAKATIHITPRATILGSAGLANGVAPENVAESCLFAEMTEDVKQQVIAAVGTFTK